jgi:predicted DNA-binding transcriptional regulator AlpA
VEGADETSRTKGVVQPFVAALFCTTTERAAGVLCVPDTQTEKTTLVRDKELAARLGVSLVTLWRMRQDPALEFPQKIQISKGIGGTRLSDVSTWLERRSAK